MTTPYKKFLSLYPTLHQVCTSAFLDDPWISWLKRIKLNVFTDFNDWRTKAQAQFELLSDLCQLANKTINDAVDRFLLQYFVVTNVLTEIDFNAQLNITLNQFFHSMNVSSGLLVDTVHLLMQVDQPYMGLFAHAFREFDPNLILNIVKNETNKQQTLQVYID